MFALPDILDYHMKVLFCGTGAGKRSAHFGQYYAGPGNKFWVTLYEIGLTPKKFEPEEFREVIKYGIGFTDLTKLLPGMDVERNDSDYDICRFKDIVKDYRPKCIAFNGMRSARLAYGKDMFGKKEYGKKVINENVIFALPSTSAVAHSHWDKKYWEELAYYLG